MFPADSHAMRQMHPADMHVAHQKRNDGTVVSTDDGRWYRTLLSKLSIRHLIPDRPETTPIARYQRREVHSSAGFTLLDATTGQRRGE